MRNVSLFDYVNQSQVRTYIANAVTLGLFGVIYVVFNAQRIGGMSESSYPGPLLSVLLTVLTLGMYPGIMLTVLAFSLGRVLWSSLGVKVLILNILSLMTAFGSAGFLIIISIMFWAHAYWLLVSSEKRVLAIQSYNTSLQPVSSLSQRPG
jgi:cbb3-type cytochrome oxidase subunit 3